MKLQYILPILAATAAIASASSAMAQSATPAGVCKANKTVAASVYALWTGSGGTIGTDDDPTVLKYPYVVTNIGNAWDTINQDSLAAPCAGTYTFSVTFVKDSITTSQDCGTTAGTFDDVYIEVWRKPVGGGNDVRIGNEKGAWAGQTGTDTFRTSGAYTVSAHLDQGDRVYTLVLSDSGRFRCIASANFDAHKIGR